MNPESGQRRLAELMQEQVSWNGWTQAAFAERLGIGTRSVQGWLGGEYPPKLNRRGIVEATLGWASGKIGELLRSPNPQDWQLGDMQLPAATPGRLAASDLTDGELFGEAISRLTEWRKSQANARVVRPGLYDLAAHRDSLETPGEEDAEGQP